MPADYLKIIGCNISALRKEKKLTIAELGYRCDMEKSNLIPIEKGRVNITIKTLLKIATALEVPLERILKFN